MTDRDRARLVGVHPQLVSVYVDLDAQMASENTPIFVVGGLRSAMQQHVLFMQGRPGGSPGKIVTDKDGYKLKSDHQVEADGWGHAIDFGFLPTKARPNAFDPAWPWQHAGQLAEAHAGVRWGGHWKQPADLDHLQLDSAVNNQAMSA